MLDALAVDLARCNTIDRAQFLIDEAKAAAERKIPPAPRELPKLGKLEPTNRKARRAKAKRERAR